MAVLAVLATGMVTLTLWAWRDDAGDTHFQDAQRQAELEARRVVTLVQASGGIPPTGAASLLRQDPLIQGPKLFAQYCSGCHLYDGHDGQGNRVADEPSAPDLGGFASREWLTGLLDPEQVDGPHYFGGTRFVKGAMVRFVKRDVAEFDDEAKAQLNRVVIALSAEAALPAQQEIDVRDQQVIASGREAIADELMQCVDCHKFYEHDYEPSGPDLTGYGSREWLIAFVQDPAHKRFYGKRNDRMPRFGAEAWMTAAEIELVVDWIRGDYVPEHGELVVAQD
jgi:ubiquinol-cytochrome c reductase cytochrome b subunit